MRSGPEVEESKTLWPGLLVIQWTSERCMLEDTASLMDLFGLGLGYGSPSNMDGIK